jgi:predicted transcriptional regulator
MTPTKELLTKVGLMLDKLAYTTEHDDDAVAYQTMREILERHEAKIDEVRADYRA